MKKSSLSEWHIEVGIKKYLKEKYIFKGTPKQHEKHVLKKYKEGAEYVLSTLVKA